MPKNLFVFSDGTGNAAGRTKATNVYRLYESIECIEDAQLVFYDDGLGTSENPILRALGGATGCGLSRNLRQLYEWLIYRYEDGDRIFLFGFSRGAFTVRCLAGMLKRCGLLKKQAYIALPTKVRERRLKEIVWAYRAVDEEHYTRWHGDDSAFSPVRVHFVGVWDTVDAVGMPIDELKPLTDRAWRKVFGRRAYGFDDMEISGVEHARQALALDDERRTFHPNVWHRNPAKRGRSAQTNDESRPTDPKNIRQVWFAGAHSNVGGGYPIDQLALVTLDWMMGELEDITTRERQPIRFRPEARQRIQEDASAYGRQYDPRMGMAMTYRYSPRRITRFYKGTDDFWVRRLVRPEREPLPKSGIEIHASAFRRLQGGANGYAPLFLPDPDDTRDFKLTASFTHGDFSPFSEAKYAEKVRGLDEKVTALAIELQPKVSRLVELRQGAYGLGLGAAADAILRASCLLCSEQSKNIAVATGTCASVVKGLLPELAARYVDIGFAHPGAAGVYLAVLAASVATALGLKSKISSATREAYERALS